MPSANEAVSVASGEGPRDDLGEARRRLLADGLVPLAWSNGPGDRYGWHRHEYRKVLFCVSGSITFHVVGGDVELRAGDRMDLAPGTEHAATVGPDGVACVEAPRW